MSLIAATRAEGGLVSPSHKTNNNKNSHLASLRRNGLTCLFGGSLTGVWRVLRGYIVGVLMMYGECFESVYMMARVGCLYSVLGLRC